MPGTAGNYVSAPHIAAYDIAGDLGVMMRLSPDTWATTQIAVARDNGSQRSWQLSVRIELGGSLRFYWWDSGGTLWSVPSTALGLADGIPSWIFCTLDVDDGSGGHEVAFFVSDDGVTWTAKGAGNAGAFTTSVRVTTVDLNVGRYGGGAYFAGGVQNARIYASIDKTDLRFDADFTDLTLAEAATGAFVEDSTNAATVTINGTAWKYVRPYLTSPIRRTGRYRERTSYMTRGR